MTTSKKTTAAKAPTAKAMAAKAERRVYVGPTIVNLQMIRNRVYIGELTSIQQDAIEKYKFLANLFVSVEEVADAQTSIRRKTGAYFEAYKLAQEIKTKK